MSFCDAVDQTACVYFRCGSEESCAQAVKYVTVKICEASSDKPRYRVEEANHFLV